MRASGWTTNSGVETFSGSRNTDHIFDFHLFFSLQQAGEGVGGENMDLPAAGYLFLNILFFFFFLVRSLESKRLDLSGWTCFWEWATWT